MTRVPATGDVWVYWECGGFGDLARVRDLSTGGAFIETPRGRKKGDPVQIHFLVPEGQIRVDGVVTQTGTSEGFGLKFQGLTARDIAKLSLLLERVRATVRG